jgi:hypothetical protein
VIGDAGITTPKQMARLLVRFSKRHPDLDFSRFVIPQVPGSMARSSHAHGVVESFLKSKKYIVPSVVVSPIFAGCVAAVYVGTDAGRFDPARQALVFNAQRPLEPRIDAEDRRAYLTDLNHLLEANLGEGSAAHTEKTLERALAEAVPDFDAQGRAVVRIAGDETAATVGLTAENVVAHDSSEVLARKLLVARLREELKRGNSTKVSPSDIEQDWRLLEKAVNLSTQTAAAHAFSLQDSYPQNDPARLGRAGNLP